MEHGTEVRSDAFNIALRSTHEYVEHVLEADGNDFDGLPNFYELNNGECHLEFLPHICSLIVLYSLPS